MNQERVDGVRSSQKAHRLKIQEEVMFQFKSEGRKKPLSHFEGSWAERILSSSEEI